MVAKKKSTKKTVAKKTTTRKTTRRTTAKKAVAAPRVSAAPRIGGWWDNSFSGAGVLVAVAAAIGIVALFCGWLAHDIGVREAFTGIDLITLEENTKDLWFGNSWQIYIPLITFVLSIIAFIAIMLPAMKVRANRTGIDALVVLCGIVIFIMAICFMFGEANFNPYTHDSSQFLESLDLGFYLTLVASIIMILGGLRDATKRY